MDKIKANEIHIRGEIVLVIRPMLSEDISAIQRIANKSFKNTYKDLLPEHVQRDFLNLAYGTQRLQQRMKNSNFYIAEEDYMAFGYINFSQLDKAGNSELLAVYIDPAYLRQKIGTKLLEEIQIILPTLKSITINMEAANDVGMKFITALGFYCIEQFIDDFQGVYLHMKRMKLFIV